MTNDTKLQLDQNTVTTKLIIPVLANANPNPTNGEMYVNSTSNHLFIYKIMHGYKLYTFNFFFLFKQKINIL